jgi:hypothetical protein
MIRRGLFGILLLACATPAFAHHGSGSFDLTKSVTFTGVLTKIELINPHSWLYFEVKEADGKMSKHRCEMRSSHVLRRSGWSNDLFPVGQPRCAASWRRPTWRKRRRGRRSGRRANRTSPASGHRSRSSWRIRAARAAAWCRSAPLPPRSRQSEVAGRRAAAADRRQDRVSTEVPS